jgi:hypothetical protein
MALAILYKKALKSEILLPTMDLPKWNVGVKQHPYQKLMVS